MEYDFKFMHGNICIIGFQFSKSVSLFRLPNPRPGEVLGLVGTNGIGKSTALKILAGKQKPNLGKFTVSSPLNDGISCDTSKQQTGL